MGFMSSVLTKVKDGTTETTKKVGKGFTDLKLGEKFKVVGNAISKTRGNFIEDKILKAMNNEFVRNISKKTKDGMNSLVQKNKSIIKKDNNLNENEENKQKNKGKIKEKI